MPSGFERHILACNNIALPAGLVPFRIGAEAVGWLPPPLATALAGFPDTIRPEGEGLALVPALRDELAKAGRDDIMIVVGGVIPPDDVPTLLEMGAAAVFPPGTVIADSALRLLEKLSKQLGHAA